MLRALSREAHLQLIRTAKREQPATMWIKDGRILDVYLRKWREAQIVIAGERIAYVGDKEPLVDERTDIIEAGGYHVVPGYIEPHAHPFAWYNPHTLSEFALRTGTTTLIADTLPLYRFLPFAQVTEIMERLAASPVKHLFWARLDPQNKSEHLRELFQPQRLAQMIEHPLVIQGGELTDWIGLLSEDEQLLEGLRRVREQGKRMEGHHPGASTQTLNIAAAAGVTACHESITAGEVINRLQLGFYAALRHSSIRPDLPELIQGLLAAGITYSPRLMFTSDGSTPPMMRQGFTDYLIRLAIQAGLPPADAYTMATLNPASYYGLDSEIGGIAPGRIADILLLASPKEPTPELVIADGRRRAARRELLQPLPAIDWRQYSFPAPDRAALPSEPALFRIRGGDQGVPLITLRNAVITEYEQIALPADADGCLRLADPDLAVICLVERSGQHVTQAVVRGYGRELEAIATTFTISGDFLVIGRNPASMAAALRRVLELNGGIVAVEQGEFVYEMPLPIGGMMSEAPMEELIERGQAFVDWLRKKGYRYLDPIFSLQFFSAVHLPQVRLTADGIYDVKRGRIIVPAQRIADLLR
ncbi:adenine deaminase C-terminal domain-containing protein [Brevibacillus marinus]|uniref:adenine deaminase C-terminal domain-containing protein n=1 Tax=Brevibacillus marinus TaxID=2496837 RepID=UPI001F496D8A|nr:adenine deaminase C-terminal domain-containing protein [Brevibacillus marinus]